MFQTIPAYPGDPILTLNERFGADPRADKVNLSIGVYLDDAGRIPVMAAVKAAQDQVSALVPHPYLPMEGNRAFCAQVQALVFGQDSAARAEGAITTVQTLGGSGALKVGADFLQRYFAGATVLLSDPTWDNHQAIFEAAGFTVQRYPYFDPATRGLASAAMLARLEQAEAGTVVVLHACCHNPTGVDPTAEQWQAILEVVVRRKLVPFFDIAYQGFGQGIEEDAYAVRLFAQQGVSLFVASSFSKNFALYGERCGALSVRCPDAAQAQLVLGQMKSTIRQNYSSPPAFGVDLITRVLSDEGLRGVWRDEVDAMRARILAVRGALYDALKARKPAGDFDYIIRQTGMFTYTGLTAAQAVALRDEHGVYVLESGRVCMAALSLDRVDRVASAIVAVL